MSVVPEAVSPESYLTASVKPLQPPHEMSANSEGAVRLIRGDIGREDVRGPLPCQCRVMSCRASVMVCLCPLRHHLYEIFGAENFALACAEPTFGAIPSGTTRGCTHEIRLASPVDAY